MRGKKSNRSTKLLPYIGAAFLATSAIALVGTANIAPVYAADSGSVNYSVTIEPVMTLSVSSPQINLLLNPVAGQTFGSQNLNVTVATNNEPGYEVYMSADSTDLTHNTDSTEKIATLSDNGDTGYTESTFEDNKWGYKIGNANYFPFVSGDMIDSYEGATNGRATTLGFAAKATSTKPAGTYTNTLDLSLVPKVAPTEMQNLDPTLCTSTPTVVSDTRDANLYTIARLADGQCWMVSDLNLAGGTKLYSETSDVPAGYPKSEGTGYFTLPASETITSGTSLPSTAFSDDSVAYVFNTGNKTTDQADCTSSSPCNSYYSWLTATAGGKDVNGSAVTSNGYNAAYSICPKGWRLPTATTSNASAQTSPNWKTGDIYKLATAYGANLESSYTDNSSATGANFYNNAGPGTLPSFLLAGLYYSGSFYDGGSLGYYWSSSSSSSTAAYSLVFNSLYVSSANNYNRRRGYPVRCILKEGASNINEIETMQELSKTDSKTDVLASMDTSTAYTLKDERDNKYYKVAKLADGQVWMTTSLNLAGGTKLYSETSDVPAGYPESGGTGYFTLPTSSTSGFSNDSVAYVYNAPNKNNPDPSNPTTCTPADGSPCDSYYSWMAATAGGKDASGSAVTGNGYNAAYSVCPKGWRLPTATTSNASPQSSSRWKTGDNYKLATAYGANLESSYTDSSSATGANFYNNAGPGTLPNFLLAGFYDSSSFRSGGSYGYYWSSSSYSSSNAYFLSFNSSRVYSANYVGRRYGYPVRCILR